MAVLRRQTSGKKAPRGEAFPELRRGGVKGVRLPRSQSRLDEDDYCPNRCGGTMLVTTDRECTCFIAAPCGSCENSYLQCSDCGFQYHNTAEDNMIVDMVASIFGKKEVVDRPPFGLYDIFGSELKKRIR